MFRSRQIVQRLLLTITKDVLKLEKVQKRFTKIIDSCSKIKYDERLKVLGITSLEDRHYRADLYDSSI